MTTVIVLIACLIILGMLERTFTNKKRAEIPIRIHVNGTRGKSSVTRLIAGGLRAGGRRVAAKTTGTRPCYIDPEGRERIIFRPGRADIREQVKVIAQAAADRAEILVVECMALQPEILSIAEDGFVRSTLGVITNVRPDHQDIMGPDLSDVARNLGRTAPRNGTLFTTERDPHRIKELSRAAAHRGATLCTVENPPPADWESGFTYLEHADNVSLAIAVCGHLGVTPEMALHGMQTATPDSGALRVIDVTLPRGHLYFANGFAANDPVSTTEIWRRIRTSCPPVCRHILIVNTRIDRVQRAEQFGFALAHDLPADLVLLIGSLGDLVRSHAVRAGLDPARIRNLGNVTGQIAWSRLQDMIEGEMLVFGCGNIAGAGQELVDLISAHAAGNAQRAAVNTP